MILASAQFVTKWSVDGGTGTDNIKFYVTVPTATTINFTYTKEDNNIPIIIPILVTAVDNNNPQLITIPVAKSLNPTTVEISIPGINCFRFISSTTIATTLPTDDANTTPLKLLDVLRWGGTSIKWSNLAYSFFNTQNMTKITATDLPDLSLITGYATISFGRMFAKSNVVTVNRINEWDVSTVQNFSYMFNYASKFNDDINNWQIITDSNVNMAWMFMHANAFNKPIFNWNLSRVNNLAQMFNYAYSFNQKIPSTLKIPNNSAQFLSSATSFNQNFDNLAGVNPQYFNNFLPSNAISTYNFSKILLRIKGDYIAGTSVYGDFYSMNYFDSTNDLHNQVPFNPNKLGTTNNLYNKYSKYPESAILITDKTFSVAETNIGVKKEDNLGFEWLTEEELTGTSLMLPIAEYHPSTLKMGDNNNVIIFDNSFLTPSTPTSLSYYSSTIANTASYNVGTKSTIYKKDTTIPQDVSNNGTIVYDFTDHHLYVSKDGIWHRADN